MPESPEYGPQKSFLFHSFHVFSVHLFIPALWLHLLGSLTPLTFAYSAPITPASILFLEHNRAYGLCSASLGSLWTLSFISISTIWHTIFYLFDHWLSLLLGCKLHGGRGVCVCYSVTGQLLFCLIQCCISSLKKQCLVHKCIQ